MGSAKSKGHIISAKLIYPTYYKTDSHWNEYGSFIAYQEIIKYLSFYHPGMRPASIVSYDVTIEKNNSTGDMAAMLSMKGRFNEIRVNLKKKSAPSSGQILISYLPKLIFIHDSFGNALEVYLKENFSKVTKYYINRPGFNYNKIVREKPDIVIEEIVERYLYLTLRSDF